MKPPRNRIPHCKIPSDTDCTTGNQLICCRPQIQQRIIRDCYTIGDINRTNQRIHIQRSAICKDGSDCQTAVIFIRRLDSCRARRVC